MTIVPLIDPPVQAMTLADGRTLTWQEFGVPDGRPVLYFHGGGSFSIEAGIFHREAVRHDIRLISTNRPGAGGSSLRPGRPVAAYSDDLRELLDALGVAALACFGESNGGLVSMAVAATMSDRVVGAAPINPTLPWHDPVARRVSSRSTGVGYWLLKHAPSLVARMARGKPDDLRRRKAALVRTDGRTLPLDLVGPPPGTEDDVGDIQYRLMATVRKPALIAELAWATSDWGFDPYSIPVPLDFYCGVYDAQGPFALVLADANPDARFHSFSYGHSAFSHPDARRRIVETIAGYYRAQCEPESS